MASSHGAGYSGGFVKARKYDLAATNIANMGTDFEKAVKEAAAGGEKAWIGAGEREGLQMWRIEKFQVVPWPRKEFGRFYSGDSYIILHTYRKNPSSEALLFTIHFWIGAESSQDEYGTAAYKTVELDDYLKGRANQCRELQGRESRKFKTLFRNIIYMEGGVDTGFHHVKPVEYRKRMLQIKGALNTVAMEVPLKLESLNSADSFILDAGLEIHLWHGAKAGIMEKNKAANLALSIDDNRGGRCTRYVYDQGDRDSGFFKALGVKPGTVTDAARGEGDAEVAVSVKRLMKVSDANGSPEMQEVAAGDDIRRSQVSSDDVFILDDGYEVFTWIGKNASLAERRMALGLATSYLKKYERDPETPVQKMLEGGDNELFEAAFEVGVKSGTDGSDATRSALAADSAKATYAGSGGQGVVTDFDRLYAANGVNPADWGGRAGAPSLYQMELQARGVGAYSAESGWVSGYTARQRQLKNARIQELVQARSASMTSKRSESHSPFATVSPYAGFDPEGDAAALRKAMKGLGTNKKTLIRILTKRTMSQRFEIADAYQSLFSRDLIDDIRKDVSGNLRTLLVALVETEWKRFAEFLHKSVKGWGTDNKLLVDILFTKEADEILKIREAYGVMYPEKDLIAAVMDDTSGDFQRILNSVLQCDRDPLDAPVNSDDVQTDAKALHSAGEAKWFGTDESVFIRILSKRSFPHIAAVVQEYERLSDKSLRAAVKSELSGNFELACLTCLDYAVNATDYVVTRIYQTMKGWGTHDWALINLIIEHCEVDLGLIKERFPAITQHLTHDGNAEVLRDMVHGDTSGSYRKALMSLLGE